MEICIKDIEEYIDLNFDKTNLKEIYSNLYELYDIKKPAEKYVVDKNIMSYITHKNNRDKVLFERKMKLTNLKKLKLPEQRSEEWYALRKKILTASSIASALDKCYFTSRDELLLGKIEEQPFEPNPITEWGVKYEDVAIMFYEELYNIKVLDFGLVPHPVFDIFGASPDGICDDIGNDDYIARMVEIKCPPKRKFTKTVPEHYWMQIQGQLEVCDLDECDFFQVKLEEYESFEEYCKDIFEIDGTIQNGRTVLNFPKGVVATYLIDGGYVYDYCPLNKSDQEIIDWVKYHKENDINDTKKSEKLFEIKYWRIERYETTLVMRDEKWWNNIIGDILKFYKDLEFYKKDNHVEILKEKIEKSKKRRKKEDLIPLKDFALISDDEE